MNAVNCPVCGAEHDPESQEDYGAVGDTIIHCTCGDSFGVTDEGEVYLLN